MTTPAPPEPDEARALRRYFLMNLTRIGSLAAVMLGIAATQGVVPLPYWLGFGLGVLGILGFFFAPNWLAKRWKASDRNDGA